MSGFSYDIAHLLGAVILMMSFALLYQRRLTAMVSIFAIQATMLAIAAGWQAYVQDSQHLYASAGIILVFKVIFVPMILRWLIRRLGVQKTIETTLGVNLSLMLGVALVGLAILLVVPVTTEASALTRETLALAMSVILLGFLTMITRRNAITQVIGFMALENGLLLAAVSARGMPFVVEISIAFSVMIAMTLFGIFFFRIRERFDSLDISYLETFRGDRS